MVKLDLEWFSDAWVNMHDGFNSNVYLLDITIAFNKLKYFEIKEIQNAIEFVLTSRPDDSRLPSTDKMLRLCWLQRKE